MLHGERLPVQVDREQGPFSANRDARSSAFFSTKALAKLPPRARTASSSRAPALAEPVAPMTSVHARNASPRPCIRPRGADLGKTARYVCEVFTSLCQTFISLSLMCIVSPWLVVSGNREPETTASSVYRQSPLTSAVPFLPAPPPCTLRTSPASSRRAARYASRACRGRLPRAASRLPDRLLMQR